jgi:hypothetical protein
MIQSKVYQLKKEAKLQNGVEFPAGQEIEIVMDVVYIGGYPLPFEMQQSVYNWVTQNEALFTDVTKKW